MGSSFRARMPETGFRTIRFSQSLATRLALQIGAPALVVTLGAVWALGLPTHAAIVAAAVAVGVLLTYAVTLHALLNARLSRLTGAMAQVERGDFIPRVDVRGSDEIADLARRFNAMLAKMTDLSVSQIESQRELELIQNELRLTAQLEAQKRQIEETNRRLEVRLRELTLLFDITRSINSTLELGELIKLITEMVGVALGFQEFAVLMIDGGTQELVVAATYGFPEQTDVEWLRLKVGEGAAGRAAKNGEIVLVDDVSREPDYLPYPGRPLIGSYLAVPLKYKDTVVGVLSFNRPTIGGFAPDEIKLLAAVANQAAMAIMNARLHQETVELSLTDALTGTANRRHLFQRLEMEVTRAQRFGNDLSLIMIDLDHFKNYNDRNGHPAGDEVLKGVAAALLRTVRKIDTVARYGGEEFAVILPQIRREEALAVGEKLRRAVSRIDFPYAGGQPGGRVTISVGLAHFPTDAQDLTQLLTRADAALYAAKNGGRNRLVAYAAGMQLNPSGELSAKGARKKTSSLRVPTPLETKQIIS